MYSFRPHSVSFYDGLLAIRSGAGLVDNSAAGRLQIEGDDSLDLLNRLTTNKLEELPDGLGKSTVITNGDGRVIDFVQLGALDGHFWCLTSPGYATAVIDWLDLYTFAEDISVTDCSSSTFQLTLAGPLAGELVGGATFPEGPLAEAVTRTTIGMHSVIVWRRYAGGALGYEIIGDVNALQGIHQFLLDGGAQSISQATWESYRIGNGMPRMDSEFGLFNNPLEARLRGAISETKGCYTGQEVIARLETYGKVQRKLMSVELDSLVPVGTSLDTDDGPQGILTSVAETLEGIVGLALMRTRFAQAGNELQADGARATLHEPAYALATEPTQQ